MIVSHFEFPQARRVALLSDTHGALAPGLCERMAGADLIVHAGDVGNAGVLDALAALAPVIAVSGNNDAPAKWPAADHDVLQQLPEAVELALPGGLLVVVHGHQWRDAGRRHQRLRDQWPRARGVVYGHSHRHVVDDEALPWVLNPGAGGRARAIGGAGWLGLVTAAVGWHVERNRFAAV